MTTAIYSKIKVKEVIGRYITNQHISKFLAALDNQFKIEIVGNSVDREPIKSVTFGNGPVRIFMWSQMHGNETTTTKAVIDLINLFKSAHVESNTYFKKCTVKIIPILNPDGAKAYTRNNANEIDLNRDAQNLSQPESMVLKKCFESFKPHYCFNLHDQRTIYNVGETGKPATISFLAPAFDEERSISESRKVSMQLVAGMNKRLQQFIPGQIGRYDDSFNPNCVGDAFQMSNTPTILFEAGHFPNDYNREKTRELIFMALLEAINLIAFDKITEYSLKEYVDIPENGKMFYDILIKNAGIIDKTIEESDSIGIMYTETLNKTGISFNPRVSCKGLKNSYFYGHKTLDCSNKKDLEWLSAQGITKIIK